MEIIPKISKVAGLQQSKKLDSIDQSMIKILLGRKEASYKELATELNLKSNTSVGRRAKRLQKEGLVCIYTKDKNNFVRWIGGIPALESELDKASNDYVRASLLAEYYDSMVTNAFSLLSILFEDHYWEIIMNLSNGLTDVELSQRTGNAINLDSIRRVMVTCSAHNLIKLSTVREPAINDPIKIFEPLYRIDEVDRKYLEYFIVIRGLASAAIGRMSGGTPEGFVSLYDGILNAVIQKFLLMKDDISSTGSESDKELLRKMLINYDFAPDLDRIYEPNINWRMWVKESNKIKIDDRTDRLIIKESLSDELSSTTKRLMKK